MGFGVWGLPGGGGGDWGFGGEKGVGSFFGCSGAKGPEPERALEFRVWGFAVWCRVCGSLGYPKQAHHVDLSLS